MSQNNQLVVYKKNIQHYLQNLNQYSSLARDLVSCQPRRVSEKAISQAANLGLYFSRHWGFDYDSSYEIEHEYICSCHNVLKNTYKIKSNRDISKFSGTRTTQTYDICCSCNKIAFFVLNC
jgi:hypothetical protein